MDWSVTIEARAPEGAALPDDLDEVGVRLLELLAQYGAAVSFDERGWSVTMSIDMEDTPGRVAELAEGIVTEMATKAGFPAWRSIRAEVVDTAIRDAELERSPFPDVVGAGEVLGILGISKQRLHQLRSEGRFPRPIRELSCGPLWLRPAVEAFGALPRPAGRPPTPPVATVFIEGTTGFTPSADKSSR
jgi:hypothetical protein